MLYVVVLVMLVVLVVSRYAEVRRASIDKNVIVPEGVKIGLDKEHDRTGEFVVPPGASPWSARARW